MTLDAPTEGVSSVYGLSSLSLPPHSAKIVPMHVSLPADVNISPVSLQPDL